MQNKIPPPIVTLICSIIIYFSRSFFPNSEAPFTNIISFIFLILGLVIIRFSFLEFKKNKTTINPVNLTKTSTLVNTGLFKYSRNPMYLGMLFILFSIAVKFNFFGGAVILLFFFFFITKFQIKPEESAMGKMFGQEFIQYKNKTRRWL